MIKLSRRQKANIKIAGLTAVSVFTLATTFTATYAWFTSNTTTTVSGMSIRVNLGQTDIQSLTVHRCLLSESTDTVLKFDSTPSVRISGHGAIETGSGIEMDNYSTLNQSQPVLLLFTFKDGVEASDVNITATADSEQFYDEASDEEEDVNYVEAFPFSSAITFKVATYTVANFPYNNVQTSSLTSPASFVTFTKDGEGAIVSSSYNNELNLYSGSGTTEITYIAVILDYFADAIDYIVNRTNFEVFANHNNQLDFTCDWVLAL